MVSEAAAVKILDCGLANITEQAIRDDVTMTVEAAEGTIAGTASYMSPEQAEGKPVDARSDIFSFGCVLYESDGAAFARCRRTASVLNSLSAA